MAWSPTPIANVAAGSTDSNAVTTGAINTTGADIIFVAVAFYDGSNITGPVDSKGNTLVLVKDSVNTFDARVLLYYASAATGAFSVGSGHSWSLGTSSGSTYCSISVAAFSGSATSSVVDPSTNTTVNNSAGTSNQTASITPANPNEIVIDALTLNGTTATSAAIDSSFNEINFQQANANLCVGVSMAYLVQTSAAAVSPTWTWTGSGNSASVIAAFNAAAGAPPPAAILMGAQVM